jgi:LmbE family N-acetylglucosaminyl deacetylase
MKRILLVASHPDDETFMTGGTVAKYVDEGWQVDLVTATRGEEGQRGPLVQLGRDKVGEVRQKELEKAGTELGIHSITLMGYKDGTLNMRTPGDIEDVVYKKMTEIIPDIVITADTTGISNHPDHIKLSYATTYAFQKYAKWIEEQLNAQEPEEQIFPKLYYACMPASIAAFAIKSKTHPAIQFAKPWKGVPDKEITTVIDISDFADVKLRAMHCHVTQTADVERHLKLKDLMKHEYFIFRMHGTTEVFMGKNDHVADSL